MPDNIRMKRIEAFFQRELSRIVSRDLKDPVFENKLISFTEIRISKDLSSAQVYVSVLGENGTIKDVVEALTKAEPLIRTELLHISDLRRVPKLYFHEDHAIESAVQIESILDNLEIPPEEPESDDESEET